MGFITNQWLKGVKERKRSFYPVNGAIEAVASTDKWSKNHDVVLELEVRQANGDYQEMYLTQDEVDKILPTVASLGAQTVRLKVAHTTLVGLSDADLLSFMTTLLAKRAEAAAATESK